MNAPSPGPENAARGRFALLTMGILFLVILTSSVLTSTQWWKSAVFAVALNLSLYAAYITMNRDWTLLRWLAVAVVAGYVELFADWWLVTQAGPMTEAGRIGNLIYGPMPKIWKSPAYMPLAWAGVLVQLMALGAWLRDRWGTTKATIVVAVAGGAYIPIYEHLARSAEWWIYVRTPMAFSNAPWYIIAGEGILCIPLIWVATRAERANLPRLVAYGALVGFGIFVAYWIGFTVTGGCDGTYPWPSNHLTWIADHLDLSHGCHVPPTLR